MKVHKSHLKQRVIRINFLTGVLTHCCNNICPNIEACRTESAACFVCLTKTNTSDFLATRSAHVSILASKSNVFSFIATKSSVLCFFATKASAFRSNPSSEVTHFASSSFFFFLLYLKPAVGVWNFNQFIKQSL